MNLHEDKIFQIIDCFNSGYADIVINYYKDDSRIRKLVQQLEWLRSFKGTVVGEEPQANPHTERMKLVIDELDLFSDSCFLIINLINKDKDIKNKYAEDSVILYKNAAQCNDLKVRLFQLLHSDKETLKTDKTNLFKTQKDRILNIVSIQGEVGPVASNERHTISEIRVLDSKDNKLSWRLGVFTQNNKLDDLSGLTVSSEEFLLDDPRNDIQKVISKELMPDYSPEDFNEQVIIFSGDFKYGKVSETKANFLNSRWND